MTMNWYRVADSAKLTTQTIRSLLDYHDVPYCLSNGPGGGVILSTTRFVVEITAEGEALYGSQDERPAAFDRHPPFVAVQG